MQKSTQIHDEEAGEEEEDDGFVEREEEVQCKRGDGRDEHHQAERSDTERERHCESDDRVWEGHHDEVLGIASENRDGAQLVQPRQNYYASDEQADATDGPEDGEDGRGVALQDMVFEGGR